MSLQPKPPSIGKFYWPEDAFYQPVEIYPNIWLSGVGFTSDLPLWCQQNNFTHIINAAGSYCRENYYHTYPRQYNIKYLELEIEDTKKFPLKVFLEMLMNFMIKEYNSDCKMLIHCVWGQSRSVACASYFIMKHKKISYKEAIAMIRIKRHGVNPNEGFVRQLEYIDNLIQYN